MSGGDQLRHRRESLRSPEFHLIATLIIIFNLGPSFFSVLVATINVSVLYNCLLRISMAPILCDVKRVGVEDRMALLSSAYIHQLHLSPVCKSSPYTNLMQTPGPVLLSVTWLAAEQCRHFMQGSTFVFYFIWSGMVTKFSFESLVGGITWLHESLL